MSGALQVVPLKLVANPASSTTTQNELLGQETELAVFGVMSVGAVHELPLNVIAFPMLSTAIQNELLGHDTEKSGVLPSTFVPPDQTPLLYIPMIFQNACIFNLLGSSYAS